MRCGCHRRLRLDIALAQAEGRDQFQKQIGTAGKGVAAQIVLVQDRQHDQIQHAHDLLGLRPSGRAGQNPRR